MTAYRDYDEEWFKDEVKLARSSAEAIVPLVIELIAPASVIDLGCGAGYWLAAFARHGLHDHVGVDGDWVPSEMLEIDAERFIAARLDQPFKLDREFDLAVSLEVAEHLPELAARTFVESVVGLAPCVLFSAAIPHQGGVHHRNEQWPQYWAQLFAGQGYVVVDAIRPRIWTVSDVAFWYRQNTFIYARPDVLAAHPLLALARERTHESMSAIVHPALFVRAVGEPAQHVRRATAREHSLREILDALPRVLGRSLRWWTGRLLRRRA